MSVSVYFCAHFQVVLASHGQRLTPPPGAVLTLEVQESALAPCSLELILHNVGIAIITHPPFITIFMGGIPTIKN